MNLGLSGKSVLVCASSRGLGHATALEFAREGASVMLCGRQESDLQRAAADIESVTGTPTRYCVADISNVEDIERLVAATVNAFGSIFTLINNCGGPPAGLFVELSDEIWQSAYVLTLQSCIRTIRAVLPHLRRGGGGRIVNFTSTSTKAPIDNLILSNTYRTAVLGLTKSLASEFGPEGVLINTMGPGRIQTDRIQHLDQIRAGKAGTSLERIRSETCKAIPLGRYGTPDEYAKAAVFLGSPVNTYITGQNLLVDGGMVRAY